VGAPEVVLAQLRRDPDGNSSAKGNNLKEFKDFCLKMAQFKARITNKTVNLTVLFRPDCLIFVLTVLFMPNLLNSGSPFQTDHLVGALQVFLAEL